MSSRIIRDWTDSESVDKLSPMAEVTFTRLLMKADDFGSYHANPKLVRGSLFPLKDDICIDDIQMWLNELKSADLIIFYKSEDKAYLRIQKFGQRLRNMRGKFPDPDNSQQDAAHICETLLETETETNKKQKQEPEVTTFPDSLNSDSFKKKWLDWLSYRSEIKKPLKSIKSINASLKQLGKYNEAFVCHLIDRSISNSWQGLIFEISKTDNEFKNFKNDSKNRGSDPNGKSFGAL